VAEISVFRPGTVPGLYSYRHFQAVSLLSVPAIASDLDEVTQQTLARAIVGHRAPLGALAIFYCIVALEDLIREMGNALAKSAVIKSQFPLVVDLATHRLSTPMRRAARRDRDAISPLLSPKAVNNAYHKALGVRPIPRGSWPKLHDLSLIRHLVAHYGGIFRRVDAGRFSHYRVQSGHPINPPLEFVRETVIFAHSVGTSVEKAIRDRVCRGLMGNKMTRAEWRQIYRLFNYFGLLTDINVWSDPKLASGAITIQEHQKRARRRIDAELVRMCDDYVATL
jgi:hypothetical protein